MNEERKRILNMVKSGKITIEEGEELLKVLEEKTENDFTDREFSDSKRTDNTEKENGIEFSFGELGNLFKNIFSSGKKGNGNIVSKTRIIEDFNGIKINNIGKVLIQKGSPQVTIESDENLIDLIDTVVEDNVLKISNKEKISFTKLILKIKCENLEKISASGVVNVFAEDLKQEKFSIHSSGASKFELNGEVENFDIHVSGAARVDADELLTKNTDVSISGAGKVSVNVESKLNVKIAGAGKLSYKGDPEIIKSITGAGKLVRL